jgi:hypothetical protein
MRRYNQLSFAEQAEYYVLSFAEHENHKMGIEIGCPLQAALQEALERLQIRDWIRLIDVSPIAALRGKILRIFRVMPDAVRWMEGIERPSDEAREAMHQQWNGLMS